MFQQLINKKMGSIVSYLKKPKKMLILGPRYSGKTAVFEHIAASHRVKPKIDSKCHFNFLKLRQFCIWDLRCKLEFLSYYCDNASSVIFLYDAGNDEESSRILRDVSYSKELRNAILLICINKLKEENDVKKIILKIKRILKRRTFMIISNSYNGEFQELREGFDWVVANSTDKRKY